MSHEMRVLLAATFVSLGIGVAAATGSATTARNPALRVSAQTVQGRHFYRQEKVRVAFTGYVRAVVRVRTSATGSFDTPLPTAYDPCNGPLLITALGARGDTARLKLPQRACPPAP
jgi:hypothetical protein